MRRPWTRRSEHSDLEKRLRDERPRPDEELVRRVSRETPRSGPAVPRFRLGVATAVTGMVLAAVVAFGGLGSPIDAVTGSAANHQYEEKVTICHRQPRKAPQTLTVSQSGAQNHLQNHPGDTAGPCPPR